VVAPDIDTVIVYKGDELSLWKKRDGTHQRVECVIPTNDLRYTRLKQIAHIHVMMTLIMDECCQSPAEYQLGIENLKNNLLPKINSMLDPSCTSALYAEDATWQIKILQETRLCMLNLLSSSFMSVDVLQQCKKEYIERLKPATYYSNSKATEVQLNCLHVFMQQWIARHHIVPESSRVIIVSPHGPRIGRIEMQYYARWYEVALGDVVIEDNLLYSIETLPSKFADLDVKRDLIDGMLIGAELNKGIGEKMLGGREKMFSDILESHAGPILDRLFPREGLACKAAI
jgi:hypothetical protein